MANDDGVSSRYVDDLHRSLDHMAGAEVLHHRRAVHAGNDRVAADFVLGHDVAGTTTTAGAALTVSAVACALIVAASASIAVASRLAS